MDIGKRLRQLREAKGLSQRDIEKLTGLMCPYVSTVECGHQVPSLATLEKWATALDIELYQVFYAGSKPVAPKVNEIVRLDHSEESLIADFRRLPDEDKKLLRVLVRMAFKKKPTEPAEEP